MYNEKLKFLSPLRLILIYGEIENKLLKELKEVVTIF